MGTSDNYSCVRCNSLMMYRSSVTLTGGYNVLLCDDCRNVWHRYVTNHGSYQALRETEIEMDTLYARSVADGADRHKEIITLDVVKQEILADLFNVAAEWVATQKKGGKE